MIMSEVFRERGDSDKAIAALKGVDEEQQFDHGSPDEHVTHVRWCTGWPRSVVLNWFSVAV